jgi:hypothetical protein
MGRLHLLFLRTPRMALVALESCTRGHVHHVAAKSMDIMTIAVRFALGEIVSDELPGLAVNLLESGYDSPALWLVAGELHPTMAETGVLFDTALSELGVLVSLREAWLLRIENLTAIVASGSEASIAAWEIYQVDRDFGPLPELESFLREYWRSALAFSEEEGQAAEPALRDAANDLCSRIRASVALDQRSKAAQRRLALRSAT